MRIIKMSRIMTSMVIATAFLFAFMIGQARYLQASTDLSETPSLAPLPALKPTPPQASVAEPKPLEDLGFDAQSHTQSHSSSNLSDARPVKKPLTSGINGLSSDDAALYESIFEHQQNGEWEEADAKIDQLSDFLLRGHVLYQRYMHPAKYRSSFEELRGWMDLYHGQPNAHKIYKLAQARAPKEYSASLRKPSTGRPLRGIHPDLRDLQSYSSYNFIDSSRSPASRGEIKNFNNRIQALIKKGSATAALSVINNPKNRKSLTDLEYAHLKAQIAATYLHLDHWDKAKEHASDSVKISKGQTALGGWVAGLAHWKDGQYGPAAAYFERAATADEASPWTISAGGYWAARAHMRTGNFQQVTKWLEIAANYPRTFYGLISLRAMGKTPEFNWDMPELTPALQRELSKNSSALRAMSLIQAQQIHLAEEELRHLHPENNYELKKALIAYAHKERLPAYQMRFATLFKQDNGYFYDSALFPVAPWQKKYESHRGNIDLAVLNAFIRQESRFRAGAENPSGATGLMQIMPSTANYVMGTKQFEDAGRERLKDPSLNMQIGEKYIYDLLRQDAVDHDLFSLAIAYNAGPGNLRRWKNEQSKKASVAADDPLFFIETIPVSETRSFVERVMTNIWIYRLKFGQPTPSLDAVAEGSWPIYSAMDESNAPKYATLVP